VVSKAWARCARVLHCWGAGAICAVAALSTHAADIYVSVDAQGHARYATQALDPSYVPLIREAAGAHAPEPRAPAMQSLIDRAARRHGVPSELVGAVAAVESNYNARAVSSRGARGPMQLMPATAAHYGLGIADSLDAQRNIDVGVRHLKGLLQRYHGNTVLALAAYNAGEGAVDRHGRRVPPYGETMLYVPTVLACAAASTGEGTR
jgi:soluble lytic murein transglycosylase-like protein